MISVLADKFRRINVIADGMIYVLPDKMIYVLSDRMISVLADRGRRRSACILIELSIVVGFVFRHPDVIPWLVPRGSGRVDWRGFGFSISGGFQSSSLLSLLLLLEPF
jgi:hypothetical protein